MPEDAPNPDSSPDRRRTAWLAATVGGLAFTAAMAIAFRVQSGSWWPAIPVALAGGTVFAAVLGPLTARLARPLPRALLDLAPSRRRAAARAALRGPAPEDPELRDAALAFARHKREETGRVRWWAVPVFLAFAALQVWVAVSSDRPWFLGIAVLLTIAAAGHWWWPVHFGRREQRLAGG